MNDRSLRYVLPRLLMLLAVSLLGACAAGVRPGASAPLSLIPQVRELHVVPGAFELSETTWLVVPPGNASVRQVAEQFAARVKRSRGLSLSIAEVGAASDAVHFEIDPTVQGDEAYRLEVGPDQVHIRASTAQGLFYGSVTLWQALTSGPGTTLPQMQVADAPRFAWRGLMLDSVRHFQSPAQIRLLLEQMAVHKLNVLHWHLTDDQGWRIQIDQYPELTRIGAWRTPPDAGHDGEPERYGGFYTQDQIRELVRYAAARYITIVPDIDLPGHAQAAVAAYPWLGVIGTRPAVSADWGMHRWLFNAQPPTVRFLQNVLDEVMVLFPSHYIHLGGDDVAKDQWLTSRGTQARIHALGLADEEQLQGWFIGQLGDYLQAHGRQMVGWDELPASGVPADAVVMSRGKDDAVAAARQGHDVVRAPSPLLSFDHLQSLRPDEAAGRVPVQSLAAVYRFEPMPAALGPAQAAHVLGVQANVWTEYMPTLAHVEHAVFPRLDALAEVAWSVPARRDWRDFLARLPAQLARYRTAGIVYADSAFAADIQLDRAAALMRNAAVVTLANPSGFGRFRYTVDGSEPNPTSPDYTQPFPVALPATVRAQTLAPDGSVLADTRTRVLDRAHLLTRVGGELVNCPGSAFRLRVQPLPDAPSLAPVYAVDPFNSCQVWKGAPLAGIRGIHVSLARLPRNYQLGHEAHRVVRHPAVTAHGELQVHADQCDGPLLAQWSLPDPAVTRRRFELQAPLARSTGTHDLCLLITAPTDGPIYAFGAISLQESAPEP